ncbi:MAG: hypothetical protein RLZZ137_334 [Cyanobacteriota bacterium]|jgi:hypothetical protein
MAPVGVLALFQGRQSEAAMAAANRSIPAPVAAPVQSGLTIGKLEAGYPSYCKALRLLIRDGIPLDRIQRTVCWDRLQLLHAAMPRQYRDPLVHYSMLKRDVETVASCAA